MMITKNVLDLVPEDIFRLHETYGNKFVCDTVLQPNDDTIEVYTINLETMEPYIIKFFKNSNISNVVYTFDKPLRVKRKHYMNNKSLDELKDTMTVCPSIINIRKNSETSQNVEHKKSMLKEYIETNYRSDSDNILDPPEYYKTIVEFILQDSFTVLENGALKNEEVKLPSYEKAVSMMSNLIYIKVQEGNIFINKYELTFKRVIELTIDSFFSNLPEFKKYDYCKVDENFKKLINFLTQMSFKTCFKDLHLIETKWLKNLDDTVVIIFEV